MYEPWRGVFYPDKLPQKRQLEYASRALTSIEINGSFYSLQKPESFARWHDETPDDFVFSVKAPKFITHVLKLDRAETPIANFVASGIARLGVKLGAILWQLPPSLRYDPDLIERFLAQLPHDSDEAAALARKHDGKVEGRAALDFVAGRPFRNALEVRNASFRDPSFIALLREYRVAPVVGDTAGRWPYMEDVTADFVYLRLHGDETVYPDGYTQPALERWKQRIDCWRAGGEPEDAVRAGNVAAPRLPSRDIYCYFDNDTKACAPRDAQRLIELMDNGAQRRSSA
ncbi:MAG TPA: DUF72 domain-containing protein [Casimicrobiaceae bacterium]|nr:DUF72 domain-containing protein [Casimicrobiaceae bacterium]